MENIFDFKIDDVIKESEAKEKNGYGNSDILRMNALMKKDDLKTYNMVVKFIPYIENVNATILEKYSTFLRNPVSDELRNIDCPSTIGKPSIFQTAYFTARDSKRSIIAEIANNFKRTKQYYTLVQVVDDEKNPDFVGKIKILQFPKQIYDKIKDFSTPESKYKESKNPFDLMNGNLFEIKVRVKDDGNIKFPDYTMSEFLDKTSSIIIDGEFCSKDTPSDKIVEFLKKNTPSEKFEELKFKEHDDETKNFIGESILAYFPEGCIELRKIMSKFPNYFNNLQKVDNGNGEDEEKVIIEEKPKEIKKKPIKKETVKIEEDEETDEIDELLQDLD